jgi:putative DNA primase/helicase
MTNYQNTLDLFRSDMSSAGMVFKDAIIADGTLHRIYVEGDKPGTKNGAYILHLDGQPAGYFEHFPSGLKSTWRLCADGKCSELPLSMRRQIEDDRKRRQLERKLRHKEAAEKARYIWHKAKPAFSAADHAYLVRKGVKPYQLRMSRGALLVPLYNESRELVNLQFIDVDGNKRFLSGGKKQGCFSVIGDSTGINRLLICEGWATGASLHAELGLFVMVAMDAGNLEPVSLVARSLFPDAEIVVAGDNDIPDKKGVCVGQTAAKNAALAVGGKYLIPEQLGADWNDVIAAGGAV